VLGAEDRVPAGWDLGDRAAAFDADLAARLGPHSDGGAFSQTVSFACELARKPGSGRRLSGSEQIADGSHRHEVPSCGREAWIDMKLGVHEVEQGRCVDHIASHGRSLAGPFGAPFSAAGGANLQVSALRMMAWPVRNALGDALWRSETGIPLADHRTPPGRAGDLAARFSALGIDPRSAESSRPHQDQQTPSSEAQGPSVAC